MMEDCRFPFGRPSTARPPRRPDEQASLFVLGVYPSALHVRWTPPEWARSQLDIGTIAALAVDDEPVVFWDGADAAERVALWRRNVDFVAGDERGEWGYVSASGNGTSGASVAERILEPLRVDPATAWFSDVVDRYFVKSGGAKRQQGDAIAQDYEPFAKAAGLQSARLPPRPRVDALVQLAIDEHAIRLRHELAEAAAPVVVTLGEEARRVLLAIADEASGPPTEPLERRRMAGDGGDRYGAPGSLAIADQDMSWLALVHPGQRSPFWVNLHNAWIERQRS